MNAWGAIYRSAWLVLAIVVMVVLAAIFVPKCHHLQQLQEHKQALQEANHTLEIETAALREKQARFESDPRYVERVARETGMVRPGEVVFHFTNAATAGTGKGEPQP